MNTIHTLFSAHEQTSWLQQRNPALKLALSIGCMLVAMFLFNIATLLLISLTTLAATWSLGKVPPHALLRGLLPFFILGLGYLWMNALFPRTNGEASELLFHLGPIRIVAAGVATGLALTARALCFGACSLFFVTTTTPTDFARSLIHQLKLSPRLAYSILAAYRLLPLLESELTQIRAAHRLRGLGEGKGIRGKLAQFHRYTIPLLASTIRKADRVAIAMESRAFTGDRTRSYYRVMRLTGADAQLVGGALFALTAILTASHKLGFLTDWQGTLGF